MTNKYVEILSVQPKERPDVDEESYALAKHFLLTTRTTLMTRAGVSPLQFKMLWRVGFKNARK